MTAAPGASAQKLYKSVGADGKVVYSAALRGYGLTVLLDHGELLMSGEPKAVVARYHKLIYAPESKVPAIREAIRRELTRAGFEVAEGGRTSVIEAAELPVRLEPVKLYELAVVAEEVRSLAHRTSASTKEIDIRLDVPRKMSLEAAIEWIADDEYVEVTPKSIRMRKRYLDPNDRKRALKAEAAS